MGLWVPAFENNPTLATMRPSRAPVGYFVSDVRGTVRATGSMRLALWKGSIQPGYSVEGAYVVELFEFVGCDGD